MYLPLCFCAFRLGSLSGFGFGGSLAPGGFGFGGSLALGGFGFGDGFRLRHRWLRTLDLSNVGLLNDPHSYTISITQGAETIPLAGLIFSHLIIQSVWNGYNRDYLVPLVRDLESEASIVYLCYSFKKVFNFYFYFAKEPCLFSLVIAQCIRYTARYQSPLFIGKIACSFQMTFNSIYTPRMRLASFRPTQKEGVHYSMPPTFLLNVSTLNKLIQINNKGTILPFDKMTFC